LNERLSRLRHEKEISTTKKRTDRKGGKLARLKRRVWRGRLWKGEELYDILRLHKLRGGGESGASAQELKRGSSRLLRGGDCGKERHVLQKLKNLQQLRKSQERGGKTERYQTSKFEKQGGYRSSIFQKFYNMVRKARRRSLGRSAPPAMKRGGKTAKRRLKKSPIIRHLY